jgi:hypothetical protein
MFVDALTGMMVGQLLGGTLEIYFCCHAAITVGILLQITADLFSARSAEVCLSS